MVPAPSEKRLPSQHQPINRSSRSYPEYRKYRDTLPHLDQSRNIPRRGVSTDVVMTKNCRFSFQQAVGHLVTLKKHQWGSDEKDLAYPFV